MALAGHLDPAPAHPGAPARRTSSGARRVALFASGLQQSDAPTAAMAAETITATVRRFGIRGCVSRMAHEFGDHPDAAAERMRWIRQITAQIPAWPPAATRAGRPGSRAENKIEASSDHHGAAVKGAA
jgi:hypothetical protein